MKIDYKQIAEYSNIVSLYIFGTKVGSIGQVGCGQE